MRRITQRAKQHASTSLNLPSRKGKQERFSTFRAVQASFVKPNIVSSFHSSVCSCRTSERPFTDGCLGEVIPQTLGCCSYNTTKTVHSWTSSFGCKASSPWFHKIPVCMVMEARRDSQHRPRENQQATGNRFCC